MRKFLSGIIGDEEQKIFVKLTSQTFVLRMIGMALLYANQVLMARLMGVSGYGDYTVIMTWINFLVAFCMFGFDHGAQRFFSMLYAKQQWGKLRGFLRFSFRIIVAVSVLCMVAWFLFLWNKQTSLDPHDRYPRTYSEAFLWSMFIIPLLAIVYQASAIFRSLHRIKLSLISVYVMLPVGISLTSLVYYQLNDYKMRADAAVLMNLLCTFLVAWYMIRRIRKNLRPRYDGAAPQYDTRLWLGAGVTYLAMNVFTLVIKQADILFVSHYFGHGEAGIYSAAVKISALIPFGLTIVDYVYTPRISSVFAKNDRALLQQYISHAAKIVLVVTVPLSLILVGAGKYLLMIFGSDFTASYLPLTILIAGQLINALTGMVGPLMTMTGNQNIFLMVYVVASVIDLLLNYLLVPRMGATGAAIASAVSVAVLNSIMYFIVWKRLKIRASFF
jgi:O-antigen/teichoic acid export membrane protein